MSPGANSRAAQESATPTPPPRKPTASSRIPRLGFFGLDLLAPSGDLDSPAPAELPHLAQKLILPFHLNQHIPARIFIRRNHVANLERKQFVQPDCRLRQKC